jgi:hypothetical protein
MIINPVGRNYAETASYVQSGREKRGLWLEQRSTGREAA